MLYEYTKWQFNGTSSLVSHHISVLKAETANLHNSMKRRTDVLLIIVFGVLLPFSYSHLLHKMAYFVKTFFVIVLHEMKNYTLDFDFIKFPKISHNSVKYFAKFSRNVMEFHWIFRDTSDGHETLSIPLNSISFVRNKIPQIAYTPSGNTTVNNEFYYLTIVNNSFYNINWGEV